MCRGVAAGFWGWGCRAENSFSDVTPGREEDQQLVASFTFSPICAARAKLHIARERERKSSLVNLVNRMHRGDYKVTNTYTTQIHTVLLSTSCMQKNPH